MINYLVEGIALGLSLGVSCLVTCGPVYASLIMQKEHSVKSATKTVCYLSLGRFLSYAFFGIAAGFLGSAIESVVETETFVIISYILLAIYLFYSAFQQGKHEKKECPALKMSKFSGNPFLVGAITGISICPAFLGAITRSFDLGGAFGGMMLFIGFFIGTTLYMLPMGTLSYFTKKRVFRLAAIFASIVVSFWFLYLAGEKIYDKTTSFVFNFAEEELYLINISQNKTKEILNTFKIKEEIVSKPGNLERILTIIPPHSKVIMITNKIPDEKIKNLFLKMKLHGVYFYLEPEEKLDAEKISSFLKGYNFKGRKIRGFLYKIPES